MSDVSAQRALLAPVEERIHRCVCPLLEGNRTRPFVGSAILLRISSSTFLISASHVLEQERTLFLWSGQQQIELTGTRHCEKKWDFAFVLLDEPVGHELHEYSVLTTDDVDIDDTADMNSLYQFVGFPQNKNRPNGRRLKRNSVSFLVRPAQTKYYGVFGYRPETHFIGEFDRKSVVAAGETRVSTAPKPTGMSGGGMFRMPSPRDLIAGIASERLIGIGILWRKEHSVLIALRMAVVLSGIAAKYPDLARHIPSSS